MTIHIIVLLGVNDEGTSFCHWARQLYYVCIIYLCVFDYVNGSAKLAAQLTRIVSENRQIPLKLLYKRS